MGDERERTDDELVRAMVTADDAALAAFERFYDRHHRMAYALAYRILGGNHTVAEEVVQEAFLALWRYAGSFSAERGNARTWFYSIVHHRALNVLRRQKPGRQAGSLDQVTDLAADSERYDVWAQVTRELDVARVRAALDTLPREQREVIALSFLGGLSNTEVAERLVLPLGTVKSRIRLGMRKLRVALAPIVTESVTEKR